MRKLLSCICNFIFTCILLFAASACAEKYVTITYPDINPTIGKPFVARYEINESIAADYDRIEICWPYSEGWSTFFPSGESVDSLSGEISTIPEEGEEIACQVDFYKGSELVYFERGDFCKLAPNPDFEIEISFDKQSVVSGEVLKANYTVSGGSGIYSNVRAMWGVYVTEDNRETLRFGDYADIDSKGTLTYTAESGSGVLLAISIEDSSGNYAFVESKRVDIEGGEAIKPEISIWYDSDKAIIGQPFKAHYSINMHGMTAKSIEVQWPWTEGWTTYFPGETVEELVGDVEKIPEEGETLALFIRVTDTNGVDYSQWGDRININPNPDMDISISFDKQTVNSNEIVSANYKISGKRESYSFTGFKIGRRVNEYVIFDNNYTELSESKGTITFEASGGSAFYIALKATDSSGDKGYVISQPVWIDSEKPTLSLRNDFTSINRYLGMTNEIEEETGVFSWNLLADVEIREDIYPKMKSVYGGNPSWKVEQTSGLPIPFTWEIEQFGDRERVDLRMESQDLVDQNIQPGNAEITISCSWGNQTTSTVISVNLLFPPNGIPTGIDYNEGSDIVECQVGDRLIITPGILPSNWNGIPGYKAIYSGNSGEFDEFCEIVNEDESGLILTVTSPGIYYCFVGMGIDTITAGRWITYMVKDENGNIPVPDILLSSNRDMSNEMIYYIGMKYQEGTFLFGEPQTEPQIDHFYLENQFELEAAFHNNSAIWNITRKTGTAELKMDLSNMPEMDLELKALPTGPEDAEWLITCDYGDAHWEDTYVIHFQNSPTGMPAGIEMDFGNLLIVKAGERLGLADKVRFKNGWSIPGEKLDTLIGGGINWQEGVTYDDQWIWDVAAKPGIYDCNVSKMCGNVRWIEPFTLIVTEKDGTLKASEYSPIGTVTVLPSAIQQIESEAFAGTKLTEIDIPAGTQIAADAFADTGLIAVYTHNDQNTIQWAVDHGIIALTD